MRSRPLTAFALASLVAITVGCSDSDDDGAAADTTEAEQAADAGAAATTVAVTDAPAATGAPVTTAAASDHPVCAELQRIEDLSLEMQQVLAPAMTVMVAGADAQESLAQLPAIADKMDELLPEILDAYADAAAVADETMALDIEAVAGATEAITPIMANVFRSADTPADLADLEQALSSPELQTKSISGAEAALRIDEFTQPECGFQFSN